MVNLDVSTIVMLCLVYFNPLATSMYNTRISTNFLQNFRPKRNANAVENALDAKRKTIVVTARLVEMTKVTKFANRDGAKSSPTKRYVADKILID